MCHEHYDILSTDDTENINTYQKSVKTIIRVIRTF